MTQAGFLCAKTVYLGHLYYVTRAASRVFWGTLFFDITSCFPHSTKITKSSVADKVGT